MARVTELELEELACKLVGLDYDKIDADVSKIEEGLYDTFGMDFTTFCDLMNKLLQMQRFFITPIGEVPSIGFVDDDVVLLKQEVQSDFINSVLQWVANPATAKKGDKTKREITLGGKVDWVIIAEKM